jgi:hypothetical protein
LLFHIRAIFLKIGSAPIINLDKIFDISIHIHPVDTAQILATFPEKSGRNSKPDQYSRREGLGP